jgi:hypothetical protein
MLALYVVVNSKVVGLDPWSEISCQEQILRLFNLQLQRQRCSTPERF